MNWFYLLLAAFGYLYISWRRFKENYPNEDVVAFNWVGLFLFLIGARLSFGLINWGKWQGNVGAWLEFWKINEALIWGGLILWILFALLIVKDKEWKLWSFLEDALPGLAFLVIVMAWAQQNWRVPVAVVIAALLTLPVRQKYRSFLWFKSGRKGFLFFWFMICLCLFLGIFYRSWWGASSLLFVGGLFMLGYDKFS